MSAAEQVVRSRGQVSQQEPTGTASLVLGAAAVAMMGCPWLPATASVWVRIVPVYFVLPLGICALVSGTGALACLRTREGAGRGRARVGTALGAVAIAAPLAALLWAFSVLGRA
ncbi:hypothetical protein [Streptomyces sp. NPDC057702]|uniref:hypothetical protein n=1 Tax=unclassified Streptomyces TaxID=2593676 RepID=UPI00367A4D46